jgi:hypothetical protein
MTSLQGPAVKTDPSAGWPFYALHVLSCNLLRESFLVSKYERCIKHAENYHQVTKGNLDLLERTKGAHPYRAQLLAGAKELTDWVRKMEAENYHELYVNSFIGMWSSFEAGLENVVADFLANDRAVASRAFEGLKRPPMQMGSWPWNKEQCLAAAQHLERAANRSTDAEWWDVFARIQRLFGSIGVEVTIEEGSRKDLAEANAVRNVLLHRYGNVGDKESDAFPSLAQWRGRVVPFNRERFYRYYNSVASVVTSLLSSVGATHGLKQGNA